MTRKSTFPVQSGAKWGKIAVFEAKNGGEMGIRTPERASPLTVFETAAFDHSAISPGKRSERLIYIPKKINQGESEKKLKLF